MSNPPHKPTDQQRAIVRAMGASGVPQTGIAAVIGVHPETLRIHYRHELDLGTIAANAKVAAALFRMATGGNVTAQIFWLKCRAGWRETVYIAAAKPVIVSVTSWADARPPEPEPPPEGH